MRPIRSGAVVENLHGAGALHGAAADNSEDGVAEEGVAAVGMHGSLRAAAVPMRGSGACGGSAPGLLDDGGGLQRDVSDGADVGSVSPAREGGEGTSGAAADGDGRCVEEGSRRGVSVSVAAVVGDAHGELHEVSGGPCGVGGMPALLLGGAVRHLGSRGRGGNSSSGLEGDGGAMGGAAGDSGRRGSAGDVGLSEGLVPDIVQGGGATTDVGLQAGWSVIGVLRDLGSEGATTNDVSVEEGLRAEVAELRRQLEELKGRRIQV